MEICSDRRGGLVHVGHDIARGDEIDVEVVGGPFVCECLDELSDATLCTTRVDRDGEAALVDEKGSDEGHLTLWGSICAPAARARRTAEVRLVDGDNLGNDSG